MRFGYGYWFGRYWYFTSCKLNKNTVYFDTSNEDLSTKMGTYTN